MTVGRQEDKKIGSEEVKNSVWGVDRMSVQLALLLSYFRTWEPASLIHELLDEYPEYQ